MPAVASDEAYGKSNGGYGQTRTPASERVEPGSFGPDDPGCWRVGVDVVDVDRIEGLLNRHGEAFRRRFFSPSERNVSRNAPRPARTLAIAWGVREAAYKAIGGGRLWTDYRADLRGRVPRVITSPALYGRDDVSVAPPDRWRVRLRGRAGCVLLTAAAGWRGEAPEGNSG